MPNSHAVAVRTATSDLDEADETPKPVETERPLPQTEVNLEDAFSKLFKSSVSGTGEEELLRIASDYALQINAKQIKCLLYLIHWVDKLQIMADKVDQPKIKQYYLWQSRTVNEFVYKWLDWKKHNNSDVFVMRALDSISLRKFINENTLKVNIEK